jgi:selenium-binding protein 1
MSTSLSKRKGPGYASPLEAMKNGPPEKILYVSMLPCQDDQPNYLATVDVDPNSPKYQQIINRMYLPNLKDEIHHYGWNACSSCHADCNKQRRFLIFGCLKSSRIYVIDTINETKPNLHKTIESDELKKFDLSAPHTAHCLGNEEILR